MDRAASIATIRRLVAYLVGPNLLMGAMASLLGVERQLVNVDYLLVGVLAPTLGIALTAAALSAALSVDAFVNVSPMYNFELPDAIDAFRDVWGIDDQARVVLLAAALVAALAATGWLFAHVGAVERDARGRGRLAPAAALVLVVLVDALNGANRYLAFDRAILPVNVATSDVVKLGEALGTVLRDASRGAPPPRAPSATETLLARTPTGTENVVLVMVESLGLLEGGEPEASVLRPLFDAGLDERFTRRSGTVPTHGSTTSAELRELCGVRASHRTVKSVAHQSCLPAAMARAGYSTVAIHGYKRTFFGRDRWYPTVGFQRASFDEDLRQPGSATCGFIYRGTCDASAGGAVHSELRRAAPTAPAFVYWLTLNAHLPLDDRSAGRSGFDCSVDARTRVDQNVCRWAKLQSIVIEQVARMASDRSLPPTRFVVVGDHPPPFSGKTRAMFVADRVPFVELVPREGIRRGASRVAMR